MLQTAAALSVYLVGGFFFVLGEHSVPIHLSGLSAQPEGLSMVKMSLDPVQVMSGQVQDIKVSPSSNGESRGSWEEKEFDQKQLDQTTKPKPVSINQPVMEVDPLWFRLKVPSFCPSSSLLSFLLL